MSSLREKIDALVPAYHPHSEACLTCIIVRKVLAIVDEHEADLNNALTADQYLKQRLADPAFAAEYEAAKKRIDPEVREARPRRDARKLFEKAAEDIRMHRSGRATEEQQVELLRCGFAALFELLDEE